MQRTEIVIPGNPGIALARIAPALFEWLGPDGYVLGGGAVLAARWQHRVSTDIDLFTDLDRYQEAIVGQREKVASRLRSLTLKPSAPTTWQVGTPAPTAEPSTASSAPTT